jgi:hypothetical protein
MDFIPGNELPGYFQMSLRDTAGDQNRSFPAMNCRATFECTFGTLLEIKTDRRMECDGYLKTRRA